ncbi:MAG: PQQ-like beta-propeller repeat protein, partial [Bifidobacteriaceae bacterium]|nr:PQQ-like beta-propeller repeat protein [Bifidobacteriaceae bacterium]
WSLPIFAPDIASRPTPGAALDSRAILQGEFAVTSFDDPLDAETGLAIGYTPLADGADGAGAAALAAFDLTSGERRWQVNLFEAAGLSPDGALLYAGARPDGTGSALAYLTVAENDFVLIGIDGQGAVVSTARTNGNMAETKGGTVLAIALPDVFALSLADLSAEIWRAGFTGLGGYAEPLIHELSGTLWAATEDGFVEATSGRALGFGADAAGGAAIYAMAAASEEPIPIRFDLASGQVVRLDPADGTAVWTVEPNQEFSASGVAFSDGLVLVPAFAGSDQVSVIAIDLASGEVRWEALAGETVGNRAGYWFTAVSDVILAYRQGSAGNLIGLDAASGQEVLAVECEGDCEFMVQGRSMAYLSQDWGDSTIQLRAVGLAEGGGDLWSVPVELPANSDWRPGLVFSETHLWLESSCQEGEIVYEVIRLIA